MKKVLFVFAVAGFIAACNNESATTEPAADTTAVAPPAADTTVPAADTTAVTAPAAESTQK